MGRGGGAQTGSHQGLKKVNYITCCADVLLDRVTHDHGHGMFALVLLAVLGSTMPARSLRPVCLPIGALRYYVVPG
jgi:hypothetical protein